jgi:hypothetical protein
MQRMVESLMKLMELMLLSDNVALCCAHLILSNRPSNLKFLR